MIFSKHEKLTTFITPKGIQILKKLLNSMKTCVSKLFPGMLALLSYLKRKGNSIRQVLISVLYIGPWA